MEKIFNFGHGIWASILVSGPVLLFAILIVSMIEIFFFGWRESSIRKLKGLSASAVTDIFSFILYGTGFLSLLGIFMTFGIFYIFEKFWRINLLDWKIKFGDGYIWCFIFFIFVDFLSYWGHRAFHEIDVLWLLHRYHHSANEMTILTTFRTHPIYDAVSSGMMVFILAMFATPVSAPLLILFSQRVHTLMLHSRFTSSWGLFGDWLFQSPAAHRVHHSKLSLHHNKNYGATLIIWDRLFNTFHGIPRNEVDKINIGVDGVEVSKNPVKYIIDHAYEFYLKLFKLISDR